jgi:DNA polymerase I-like protein with 3'-5' exonuclease and polymerase domains
MRAAYESGDCYLTFAKQAGAVPESATKESHPIERESFKSTALAVIFGMEWQSLALRLGQSPALARDYLAAHHSTYRLFWQWSDAALDSSVLTGAISTTYGWTLHISERFNSGSVRNFPTQGNGADMMRIAACLASPPLPPPTMVLDAIRDRGADRG